ncbi:MAG TPA: hypothetical protein VM031_03630 [Phycisphaerae bacterium]|nr:hypothetical protein [Phycisphaerae bacterium]
MKDLSRRDVLAGLTAGVAASVPLLSSGCTDDSGGISAGRPKALPKFRNDDFYKDGKFDPAAAKDAYYTLMAYHGFPIMPVLKTDEFWVLDFGLDNFAEAGMGGIFYINDKRDDYLLHDIWLLPGQMIPEHCHLKLKDVAAKMEAWLVRYGMAYMYHVGKPTPEDEKRIPPLHQKIAVARAAKKTLPGEVFKLEVAEQKHFMLAGPEGAIVTEVATYHSMEALAFTHPKAKV